MVVRGRGRHRDLTVRNLRVASIGAIDIRPADIDDVDGFLDLLSEAAAWTATLGFGNWPARFPNELVVRGVTERTLHVAEHDGALVATLNLQWSDEMFWGEQRDDAGYIHRLAVRRDHAGAGLGAALIDWASEQVRATGRRCLRLDAPADNLPLCSYYERLGFAYRGDREGAVTESDGGVRRWRTRLYERECHEEQQT